MASWQSSHDGRGTGRPRNLTLELGNSDFRLYFRGVGMRRLVAVLVAVGLVTGVGVLSAGAQEDFPAVDQPGVTADRDPGRRGRLEDQPPRRQVRRRLRRRQGVLRHGQRQGRDLRARPQAHVGARRPAGQQPQEVQALLDEDIFAVLPVSVLLFSGADLLADAGIPTFGWNINEEWTGPPNLFGEKGSFLDFTGASVGLPYLAKKLGCEEGRRARLHRRAVDGLRRRHRELVREVPGGRGRVHRHQPVVRRHRPQRRGLPDERGRRRPGRHLHGQQRRAPHLPAR